MQKVSMGVSVDAGDAKDAGMLCYIICTQVHTYTGNVCCECNILHEKNLIYIYDSCNKCVI